MKIRYLVILITLLMPAATRAQTDTLFWFASPYTTISHNPPLTVDITLTATDLNSITTVTISQPYNKQIADITVTIDPAVSLTKNVHFTQADVLLISSPIFNSLGNSAIKIRANHEITAYYETNRKTNNPAIYTLKGKNALGTDFWTPFQNQWPNHDWDYPLTDTDGDAADKGSPAFSQIIVVATEENTDIIVRFKTAAYGYPANTDIPIHLDHAGQTYMFVPKARLADNNEPSILASDRLAGTHITSNKPIAVTLNDDSVQKSGAYDEMGDQSIPTVNANGKTVIGKEYIVMKGKIGDLGGGSNEKAYVLTTQANTSFTVYHKSTGLTTNYGPYANAGTQVAIDMLTNTNDYFIYINATQPVYVLHIAGFGDELGDAVLPTIDGCTGSLSVSFTKSKKDTVTQHNKFYLNLMTKADAIDSFYISIDGNPPVRFLDKSKFEQAGTSSWYVLIDGEKLIDELVIPTRAVTRIFNTKNVFHLGYFNGVTSGGGCVYGYFSDYNELEASATVEDQGNVFQKCDVDSIELKAKGGISYHWSPSEYLDDPNVQNPILRPPYGGFKQTFEVQIEQPCLGPVLQYVYVTVPKSPSAFLTVDQDEGCAPVSITMKDASKGGKRFVLDLGDGTTPTESTSPFNLDYVYQNTTNQPKDYIISYMVSSRGGCNAFYADTIHVFPQVVSDFRFIDPTDTSVCHATNVGFKSTSSGNTDTYLWNFGDGSSDVDTMVTHIYNNPGLNDTTFQVSLVATSPFGCNDTSVIKNIRVFPYIFSSFTIDSTLRCSPAAFFLNPKNSIGVDTFYWSFSDVHKAYLDSAVQKNNENPILFNHKNINHLTPDTIQIALSSANRFGCSHSAPPRTVIIYPEVNADFITDKKALCDSVDVLFTNKSTGYNIMYTWDFGNGTSKIDSSVVPFTKFFYNRTDDDTIYKVSLMVASDYYCRDTARIPITVHPFVKATFGVDYSNNCSPLNVEIVNISKGGDEFNWNLGDGSLLTTFVPDTLYHKYENNTDNDTTFYIHLNAKNNEGCSSSALRSVSLFPRVIAGFGFDSPDKGCNPLNVLFKNNSKGKNLNYIWDFGDKTYSASENPPPRLYQNSTAKDTTYYVNLTVMNLAGCDSSITHTVNVYSKVTADFAIARVDSCSPFKIAVSNFSTGGITDFVWKYNLVDSLVLHTFTDPDIPLYRNQSPLPVKYPVILKTRNAHGCQASKNDTVTVFPELHASFHPDIVAGCQPLPVSFSNQTNIITGTSFFWDFDDGRYSNLSSPAEHLFNNTTNITRPHNVVLEATSPYGCFDDTLVTVKVYPYIFAKFTVDKPAICSMEPFMIDRTGSLGAINHYNWTYQNTLSPDGEKADPKFSYTYSNKHSTPEKHTITLTVTNSQGCDTSWAEKITVNPEVRTAFALDKSENCYPSATSFTNSTKPAVPLTYYWDFGDGSGSIDKIPSHEFKNYSRTADQKYTITLTATSQFGCDSSVSRDLVVHPKPLADFSFPKSVDCPPFIVPFANNSQGTQLTYLWNFDNGETSPEANPVITFTNAGSVIEENTISLITTTAYSCSDTVTRPISVYPEVKANFTASAWNGCNPLPVTFDGTATNQNEYYWFINDKVFSNYEDPFYRFINESPDNKTFDIRFKAVSINGCFDDTLQQVVVYPKPLAEFLPEPQIQDFNTTTDITTVIMNNITVNQGAWNYSWNFGDGTSSTADAAFFNQNYRIWGDISNENRIPVSLIATNKNNSQCADTILHYVTITPPKPKVDLGQDITGCMPLTVSFPASTKYNYPDSYQWDFGYAGQTSMDAHPSSISYDAAGEYIVRLSIAGDGGTNWDYKRITVYPKPTVDFSFTPDYAWLGSQTEDGTPIKFFNTTQDGISYVWEFGDGEMSTDFQPEHEYMSTGTFYITLIAESGEGCLDTLTHETPVLVEGRGSIKFPNVITIEPGNPAEEIYNPGEADPRIFRPVAEGIEKYRLEIYNRWGELIFTSDDVNKGWNGYIKDSPVKQDVYVWRVRATFTNGSPYVKAGDVTVLVKQSGNIIR